MNQKKLIALVFGGILLLAIGVGAFSYYGKVKANEPPQPAENVTKMSPDNATNLRFLPISLTGSETQENLIIYDLETDQGLVHNIEVIANQEDQWEKVFSTSINDSQGKFEGIQRVDFERDGKQELFILINSETDSSYTILSYENGKYGLYNQPSIDDPTYGDVITFADNETGSQFISFNVAPEGIHEIYAVLCDKPPSESSEDNTAAEAEEVTEEAPKDIMEGSDAMQGEDVVTSACRAASFLVTFDNGNFTREYVELNIQPAAESNQ